MLRTFIFIFISCVVSHIDCYNYKSGHCNGCRNDYTIIRRSKYYPSSPFKFYNRPPFSPPIRGPFSYTPPPGYTANDVGPPISSNSRPYKVSKRPTNEGLGEEDLNNLFKYLSKKDLDKIVDYANERDRSAKRYREPSDTSNYDSYPPDFDNNENISYQDQPYNSGRTQNSQNTRPDDNRYYGPDSDSPNTRHPNDNNYQFTGPLQNYQPYSQGPLDAEESMRNAQFSFLDAYIQKEIRDMTPEKSNIYTDSNIMQEEILPRPTNLRNDDHDVAFTSDNLAVVEPEKSSYKLENFANLPLMDYENSKLHSVDSYNVPHYSVTSNLKSPSSRPSSTKPLSSFSSSSQFLSPSSNNNGIEVEPAPPASVAKEQSDAHLKAIRIWTHKSKGTAYTLHDDGTLSLEKPIRPKFMHN